MIGVLLAMLLLIVVGLPLAMALPAAPRRLDGLLGEAWLLGSSAGGFVLLLLSIAGIAWSRGLLIALLAGIALVAAALALRHGGQALLPVLPKPGWANLIDLFTLALVAGHARLATLAVPVEADYIFIWGMKAVKFWIARGIDWEFLESPQHTNLHPSYPVLTPLVYDVHALVAGAWPDRWIGLITTAFGVAGLLVIRAALAEEMGKVGRAVATAILVPLVFSPYIGLAEGPLIACAIAGLLHLRQAARADRLLPLAGEGGRRPGEGLVIRGAVFLGLAASYKDEGLALIIAAAIAMLASGAVKLLPRLWPAIALALPWSILFRLHDLPAGITGGSVFDRLLARIADAHLVARAVLSHSAGTALFWIGVAAAFAIGFRRLVGTERFLAVAIGVQLLFILSAYFIGPWELEWHVRWSWPRIVRQLMPLVAFLALVSVGEPKVAPSVIRSEPEEH